ncbi:hypothetical protein Poly30_00980 [Planctomycetes bacterium Poly30]|uniref:Sialate O-acetylesterase domain-containing protein n=2 Tax=Saltatorellus ferox TaxID=2528018 RepID=A0A518EKJ0_9BACT|nr:hypothetical protein Poly30_00980 [Planctomycetes bacterium Poly30]
MQRESGPRQYGNFRDPSGGFGPEIGFARCVMSRAGDPRSEAAILKVAFSGTSLLGDWDPEDPGDKGACYRALIQEFTLAMAELRARGHEPRVEALLWIQGESDANAAGAERYPAALEALLYALRRDLAAPEMIALLAVNTKFGGGENPWVLRIAAAQQLVANRDPRSVYVDTSAASIANGAHYDAAGTLLVGRRMGEALVELQAR